MAKVKSIFGALVAVIILFFYSCETDEAIAKYENPNLTDTTGVNVSLDLFISGELDNIPFHLYNGTDGYSNWAISGEDGFCTSDPNKFIQTHSTAFLKPSKREESFFIDIRGCVNNDSLQDINKIDSVLVVGPYVYYPKDTEGRSAIIRYIDADSMLWSSAFGGNTSSFVKFELSALVNNNQDTFSQSIVYGKFEGYLFNGFGDSLRLKSGQFKGRLVE